MCWNTGSLHYCTDKLRKISIFWLYPLPNLSLSQLCRLRMGRTEGEKDRCSKTAPTSLYKGSSVGPSPQRQSCSSAHPVWKGQQSQPRAPAPLTEPALQLPGASHGSVPPPCRAGSSSRHPHAPWAAHGSVLSVPGVHWGRGLSTAPASTPHSSSPHRRAEDWREHNQSHHINLIIKRASNKRGKNIPIS